MTARVSVTSSGFFSPVAQDGQRDLRILGAAHPLDRFVQRHALNAGAVDRGDEVAGLDAGMRGGRVVDRGDDLHEAVFLRHFEAEAAEFAAGLHLHVGEFLGVHVARVRVERADHAVDGRIDQFGVIDFAHIIGTHAFKGVTKEIEFAIGRQHIRCALRGGEQSNCTDKSNRHANTGECELFHVPFAFPISALTHGAGSTTLPLRLSSI